MRTDGTSAPASHSATSIDVASTATPAALKARHEMTVCNACRYCEAYCPVFHAMEDRLTFSSGDVAYLANLCHNCGECLYACQYAPPHEFGIEVPRTFSEVRVESYEAAAWPPIAAGAFRRPFAATIGALVASASVLGIVTASSATDSIQQADFYSVIPHSVMVTLFGVAGIFTVLVLSMGRLRFARTIAGSPTAPSEIRNRRALATTAHDVLTLRHLHPAGEDCTGAEESRHPWRRWMHHCTFYGFLLCFASTSVAAVYHLVFGWVAPYGYTSVPVLLGTAGGIGLIVGPAGLFVTDRRRDPALTHPAQASLDLPFLAMLFMTSLTGLLLLALREQPDMPSLLVVHLAFVLALFVTMPYGKFVHGIYRAMALAKYRRETKP